MLLSIYLRHAQRVETGGRERALTLAAAAEELGVTPQRISQMLGKGQLQGPAIEGRASPNAERVWEWSLKEAATRPRRRGPRKDTFAGLQARVAALELELRTAQSAASPSGDALSSAENRERAARSAALHLKVAADTAAEEVARLRARNDELLSEVTQLSSVVSRLEAQLAEERARAELETAMRGSYGDGLSQFLTPGDPSDTARS